MSSQEQQSSAGAATKKFGISKGEELNDFLASLDGYRSTVPEALTSYYMEHSGVDVKDDRIIKLVSLAADKVLTEILYEGKQISKLRQQAVRNPKRRQEMSESLELEDVAGSLSELRVFFRRKRARPENA